MKQIFNFIIFAIASFFIFSISSCKKDAGTLPDISFKTGAGYTSANATVARNTAFKVGINAAKTEKDDVLKTFNISVSFDGGTSTTVYSETLTAAQGDNYTYDFNRITRNQAGTEKYTFTITNRDGLINTISLTITVP
ncbi:MAG: hypothetical protein M3004_02645 [Bacteroidota bacterium]|nr:hypothetical protein [Bacteroidota bacterium]